MKFYIISAALNAALLFIPIAVPVINNIKQDNVPIIIINLENSTFEKIKEGKTEESEKIEKRQEIKKNPEKYKGEKSIEKSVFQEKKDTEIKTLNSENKVKADENKFTKAEPLNSQSVPVLNTDSGKDASSKTESISSERKTGQNKQNQNIKKEPGGNVCRENIDYTVTYNPDLQYPMAAERLGIKKTVIVNVRINFNGNGSVSVIGASGGEGVFQSEAKKAAEKIRVKIKNPETLKCTVTKPFRFKSR
ncbi:TonB family protein [Leptotrichia sp. OH3620_COT-345]|uniref:TonB family protein n=1 Tax=Leptotrichia sp. OH3620_COT-345 TaxID=2491048 RepID=UPI000F64CB6D|nr:TonB family protein [Leptotrichia sp. OH3620_COT-345]RRD40417.1 TonB family protein [Leptotrichia sp. OH3620_COT-345]